MDNKNSGGFAEHVLKIVILQTQDNQLFSILNGVVQGLETNVLVWHPNYIFFKKHTHIHTHTYPHTHTHICVYSQGHLFGIFDKRDGRVIKGTVVTCFTSGLFYQNILK